MKIQFKRTQTQTEWEASDVILAQGEPGVALDTGAIRYGNGVDVWSDLPTVVGAVTSWAGRDGDIEPTKDDVGLDQVDNTADVAKPISAAQAVINGNLAEQIASLDLSGATPEMIGLGNVDNTHDLDKPVSAQTQIALNFKANTNNPTFTGNVLGISKSMVGLAQVDNTSDASKPLSTAATAALANKVSTGDSRLSDARNPLTGSVTNSSVSSGAAISLDKTADTATRVAMTPAERAEVAASVYIRTNLSAGVVAAGPNALASLSGGTYTDRETVAVGSRALQNATYANGAIAIGIDAQQAGIKSVDNIALGNSALKNIVTNSDSSTGVRNIGIGNRAGLFQTTSHDSISIGNMSNAGRDYSGDIAIGSQANKGYVIQGLSGNWEKHDTTTPSGSNIALGEKALGLNGSGYANFAVGETALSALSAGQHNFALGSNALPLLGKYRGPSGLTKVTVNKTGTYTWSGTQITVASDSHGLAAGDFVNIVLTGGTFTGGNVRGLVNAVVDGNSFTITEYGSGKPIKSLSDSGSVSINAYERASYTGIDNDNIGIGFDAGHGLTGGYGNFIMGSSSGPQTEINTNLLIAIGTSTGTALTSASNVNLVGNGVVYTTTSASNVVALGNYVTGSTTLENAVAIGHNTNISDSGATVVGNAANGAANSVAIGSTAVAVANSVAIGVNAVTAGTGLAVGNSSTLSGNAATALGRSSAAGLNGTAVGDTATAGESGVAVGANAAASGNGIAVGSGVASAAGVATFANSSYTTKIEGATATLNGIVSNVGTGVATTNVNIGNAASAIQIGTSNSGGTISLKAGLVTVDDVAVTSDQRDKTDIRPTHLGLDFINRVQPVEYRWSRRTDMQDGRRYHQGVIAQQLQSVIEETGVDFGGFVDQNVGGGPDQLLVRYDEFVAPLIKAVQELHAEVEELKKRVSNG